MKGFTVQGDNRYTNCQMEDAGSGADKLTGWIQVEADTPALYACISDPVTGLCPDTAKVRLTVTGPDGTVYNRETNTENVLVRASGGYPYAMCVLSPAAGRWTMACESTAAVSFRANLATVPAADPMGSAVRALVAKYPGDLRQPDAVLNYLLARWSFWPAAVLLAAATALPSPLMNLTALIMQLFGTDSATAQRMRNTISGQTVPGVINTICQQTGCTGPTVYEEALPNGDGAAGLSGWTILASGGSGWSVQTGYAGAIDRTYNFAASNGWCKKARQIDLLQQAGLTAAYLDQAPVMRISDWVAAFYPAGTTDLSRYYLLVKLLDAGQNVIKQFQTGNFEVPPGQGGRTDWSQVSCTFSGYGAGARHVYLEHGGMDPRAFEPRYGVKMTGAEILIQMAIGTSGPPELLRNGSAVNGMDNWTNSSPVGNPWTAESGPAAACPGSPGNTGFAVASGTGKKYQVIDLVAAGYDARVLDNAPLVTTGQWVASHPGTACGYGMKVELRDQSQRVIRSYDSGSVQIPATPGDFVAFRFMPYNFTGYGSGLRFICFEHSATPAQPVSGQAPAKITGATVKVQATLGPPPTAALGMAEAEIEALEAAPPVPVANPGQVPYRWACILEGLIWMGGVERHLQGSGWLIPPLGGTYRVVTVAHNVYYPHVNWVHRTDITPAKGSNPPFSRATVGGNAMQLPIEWFIRTQATPSVYGDYHDYAMILVTGVNWPNDGFSPTVEDDAALNNQPGTATGFPGTSPYTPGLMYSEDLVMQPFGTTEIRLQTPGFHEGASGSPVYARGTDKAVGVFSRDVCGFLSNFWDRPIAARLTPGALRDLERWSTPLSPDERVCRMQWVIHTDSQFFSGTTAPAVLTLDGKDYPLESCWMGGGNKVRGAFDGYDLSQALAENYPNGLRVRDLRGMGYELKLAGVATWWNATWSVDDVILYVNGHRSFNQGFSQWIERGKQSPVRGQITI